MWESMLFSEGERRPEEWRAMEARPQSRVQFGACRYARRFHRGESLLRNLRSREKVAPGRAAAGRSRQEIRSRQRAPRDFSRRARTSFKLAGPGAEKRLQAKLPKLSGRSQRGDSAWYKTLDHLLSLLMGGLL